MEGSSRRPGAGQVAASIERSAGVEQERVGLAGLCLVGQQDRLRPAADRGRSGRRLQVDHQLVRSRLASRAGDRNGGGEAGEGGDEKPAAERSHGVAPKPTFSVVVSRVLPPPASNATEAAAPPTTSAVAPQNSGRLASERLCATGGVAGPVWTTKAAGGGRSRFATQSATFAASPG